MNIAVSDAVQQSSIRNHQSSIHRLALLLEYDGAAYGGSQRQVNAPSVQAALEEAIRKLSGEVVRTAFAGRTDAGVHAVGQVVAFDTAATHTCAVWQRGLNALLPDDIAVRAAVTAPAGFDPRRQACSRTYRYRIWNAPARSPAARRQAWHVRGPLDVGAMRTALAALVGEHDFAAFGGSPGPGRSTRRRMLRAELGESTEDGAHRLVEMEGTAFLPHQVRRTVGALVEVGRGRLPAAQFARWLAHGEPGAAGPAAPAHGLCLMQVTYSEIAFTLSPLSRVAGEGSGEGAGATR